MVFESSARRLLYLSSLDRSVSDDDEEELADEEFSSLRCDGFCTVGCELFELLTKRERR